MNIEENKRAELREKYENWIKKNKLRLFVVALLYIVVIVLNLLVFKNQRVTILASLLMFTYGVYVYSLVWFINKKLLTKINEINFKIEKSDE